MKGQRGQALISVLVIMTLIFIAAGVVAVGTYTLVVSERQPDSVVANDLIVQSAVAAAIGRRSSGCSIPPTADVNGGSLVAATFPTLITIQSAGVNSYCVGLSSTPGPPLRPMAQSVGGSGNCWTIGNLPALSQGTHWWIVFNATWPSGSAPAIVDVTTNTAPAGSCPSFLHTSPCDTGPAIIASGTPQVAIDCEMEAAAVPQGATLVFQGVHPSAILFGQGGYGSATTPTYFILREHFPPNVQQHDEEAMVGFGSGVPTVLYEAQLP